MNETGLAVVFVTGSATSFSYDAVGRLTQATDSVGGTVEHTYDAGAYAAHEPPRQPAPAHRTSTQCDF